jgi:hypothetical protein
MKSTHLVLLLSVLALATACQKSESTHANGHSEHQEGEGGNQKLYEEVMAVHDEVMPKMNDIYKLKEGLKKQIAETPDMAAAKKKEMESVIIQLDSASESMMVWMRNFDPIPDSLGVEKARQYLEEQKAAVEEVKEDMLDAIEEAERIN